MAQLGGGTQASRTSPAGKPGSPWNVLSNLLRGIIAPAPEAAPRPVAGSDLDRWTGVGGTALEPYPHAIAVGGQRPLTKRPSLRYIGVINWK